MPVPFIVLRILDELDRAGLWVEVDHHGVHVWPTERIPPALDHDVRVELDELSFYLEAVKRQREVDGLTQDVLSPHRRWARCWWKPMREWDADKASDLARGIVEERRP